MQNILLLSKHLSLGVILLLQAPHLNAQTKDPDSKPSSIGIVSFIYQGKKVTYSTVRANDSNIWLQQNLGSTRVAQKQDDELSYGDLFQWGRWDDSHQLRENPNTRNGMPKPANPGSLDLKGPNPFYYEGVRMWWSQGTADDQWNAATPTEATATNGCDPCKALGPGWRLPTRAEWDTVFTREFITDINGSMRSNLKLPLAGFRDVYDYYIVSTRANGMYWTSNPYQGSMARLAALTVGYATTEYANYRTCAMSIRCLKSSK